MPLQDLTKEELGFLNKDDIRKYLNKLLQIEFLVDIFHTLLIKTLKIEILIAYIFTKLPKSL